MKNKTMLLSIGITLAVLLILHLGASRTLTFNEEVQISVPIEAAWDVLGNQFTAPHLWSTNFKSSAPGGDPKIPGLTFRHRATITANGDNWQELDAFNPEEFSLSYHISKGIPSIAKKGTGHWKLTSINPAQTRLNVDFVLETKGLPGLMMSPVVRKKVAQSSREIVAEFKYYLENKKPHPRKLQSLKSDNL